MGFFEDLDVYECVLPSGFTAKFRGITTGMIDLFIKDLRSGTQSAKKAYVNLIDRVLIDINGEKAKASAMLSGDAECLLLEARKQSIGGVFEFEADFGGGETEAHEVDLNKITMKRYGFDTNKYQSYLHMVESERKRQFEINGKAFNWMLPLASSASESELLLQAACEARQTTYKKTVKSPEGQEIEITDRIDWSEAPQKYMDLFAKEWKKVEGGINASYSVTSKSGKTLSLNILQTPGFFAAALAN